MDTYLNPSRCEVDFNIVEEKLYKEECKVNVQHICEEHIKVPVPYPVKAPYPGPQPEAPYASPHPEPVGVTPTPHPPDHEYRNYLTTPVPPAPPPSAYQPSVLGEPLVGNLFKRRTRAADDEGDETLQGIVKQVLLEAMQKKTFEMNTKIKEESDEAVTFPVDSSPDNPFNIPVNLLASDHPANHQPQHHFDLHGEPQPHLLPVDPPFLVPADLPHPTHLIPPYPPGHPAPEHPPIVTSYEIPAPPGCRSLATKTCWKIPIIVPKKVPFETCREVPDVECVTVVKNKPEIECTPEPYQDCNDVAKDIPYLEPGEECEEIFFDECREVG